MRSAPYAALALFWAAGTLTGCMPAMRLAYTPGADARPVSRDRRVALAVKTESGVKVAAYSKVPGTQEPLSRSLWLALRGSLQHLEMPPADSTEAADGLLEAVLLRAEIVRRAYVGAGLGEPIHGVYSFRARVRDRSGREVFSKAFTGEADGVRPAVGFPTEAFQGVLSAAMSSAVDQFGSALEAADLAARLAGREPAPVAGGREPVAAAPPAAPAPLSDVDDLPAARPRRKAHAVVIGIERYREALPRADFAAGDARLAAEYAKRLLGVPEEDVALLIDDRATRGDFEKHFERWLPNRVEPGDEVFVYFSGHGAPNPAKGDAYLVPYDGDPTYIEQTGYPLKKLYEQLGRLPAKRVLVAMDSCFSGAGGRSVLAKGARPLVAVSAAEAVPANVTVLAASAGDQVSNSYQEKGHGLFTYYLLKGLKEKGGDVRAAFDYLKPEVARTARREYNADQDPQWREGR